MKSAQEIIQGLACCTEHYCEDCPYSGMMYCEDAVREDAAEYIRAAEEEKSDEKEDQRGGAEDGRSD